MQINVVKDITDIVKKYDLNAQDSISLSNDILVEIVNVLAYAEIELEKMEVASDISEYALSDADLHIGMDRIIANIADVGEGMEVE